MKKIAILFIVSFSISSFTPSSDLYNLGFNTGKYLGTSETYSGHNYQLYLNTIDQDLGPGYDDYKAGVREGYSKYKFVGTPIKPAKCSYWSQSQQTWVTANCGSNVE